VKQHLDIKRTDLKITSNSFTQQTKKLKEISWRETPPNNRREEKREEKKNMEETSIWFSGGRGNGTIKVDESTNTTGGTASETGATAMDLRSGLKKGRLPTWMACYMHQAR